VCAVDVCTGCDGIWLDAGEFERLDGYVERAMPAETSAARVAPARTKPVETTHAADWHVPEPTRVPLHDPYLAPGHARPTVANQAALHAPSSMSLACVRCATGLDVWSAHALNGDLYCSGCRPPGAVAGSSLPDDSGETTFWDRLFGVLGRRVRRPRGWL
jgi:hypothetical protein